MIEFRSEMRDGLTRDTAVASDSRDRPKPGRGEVLIKLHAAAVNPAAFLSEDGKNAFVVKTKFPHGSGLCVSGIVVARGANVTGRDLGDAVYGYLPNAALSTCAVFQPAHAAHVREMPLNADFREAAALPLVGSAVIQAFEKNGPRAGDRILIHEGGGAVGSFAIQYAKFLGATVFTTTSTENADWVRELGADGILDYQLVDYRDELRGLDMVLDTLGGDATFSAFDVIRPGGAVVSLFGPVDDRAAKRLKLNPLMRQVLWFKGRDLRRKAKEKSARYSFVPMVPDCTHLATIRELVESGTVRPVVDTTSFDPANAMEALAYHGRGRAQGTIVLDFSG
ncbi:NADP-dependent oxidoreductase [Roseibium sp.]|uniref:NADP-dependent oxidoreductase n=1 Tax=Roseibium sp. TaxID=1936156 RepID=UPI003B50C1EA